MSAEWVSGRLYGEIPEIGPVLMRFQEDQPSTVSIRSQAPEGDPFFPAAAEQRLYYALEVLDDQGQATRTLLNVDAMPMTAEINSVPPFGVTFAIDQHVVFADPTTSPPKPVIALRADSTGSVDNPGGIDISHTRQSLDAGSGEFALTFEITPVEHHEDRAVIWWVSGLHGTSLDETLEGTGALTGTQRIDVTGRVDLSEELTGVICHAFTQDEPVAEGHLPVYLNTR